MAWTVPITFVPGTVLTASQLNIHVRDNLNEMAPARASAANSIFVTTGKHQIREQFPQFDFYEGSASSTTEQTTSHDFVDLKFVGPDVTTHVTFGALVSLSVRVNNTAANAFCIVSFGVTKVPNNDDLDAEEIHPPSDERSLLFETAVANQDQAGGYTTLIGVPEPGDYTFTMKYRVTAGTGTFYRRWLSVIPF